MLVCAFFCATLHTRPRVQRAPGIPCSLCSFEGQRHANLGQITPREGEVMLGSGNAGTTPSLSSSAKAGDPVRRGLSAQSLRSLEYWIAWSRLRQPPSSEGGLRRSRGYAAAPLCWRAEALAKAASRRRRVERLKLTIASDPTTSLRGALTTKQSIHFFYAARWIASLARSSMTNGMRVRAPRWLGMTTGWPRGGGAAQAGAEPTPGTGPGNPAPPRKRPDWLHFPPLSSFLVTSP